MTDTLLRHWAMLSMVPRHPQKITVVQLRKKLEEQGFVTTPRTIQRDLEKLSGKLYALQCDDGGKPYGWQWAPDMGLLDIPGMAPQAALSFKLAEEFLQQVMPSSAFDGLKPHFRHAVAVLGNAGDRLDYWISENRTAYGSVTRQALPDGGPRKVEVISRGQALIPPDVEPGVLWTVYSALAGDLCFRALYWVREDAAWREYEISPLGLVFRDGVIHLVASIEGNRDLARLFLHRMRDATPLEVPVGRPDRFDFQGYVREHFPDFRLTEESTPLHIRLRRSLAEDLRDTPLSLDQTITDVDDDWAELTATIPNTSQLRWWLLGFGDTVAVLAPAVLRRELAETLRRAAGAYT